MDNILELLEELKKTHYIDRDGIVKLLSYDRPEVIFSAADEIRKKYVGNDVHLRGLIEFSNYCCRSCFYCGLRAMNRSVQRYRLSEEEILNAAKIAAGHNLKTIVLQGGEDKFFSVSELCRIVEKIKNLDVAITLSIGELPRESYAELKRAGADRYLLRIETSSRDLYEGLHPGMSFENRVNCLYNLKDLGFETGTGSLVGLPGQTPEILAEDLLFFKKLDADMIGIGPFIPCPGTPLENEKAGKVEMVLKMLSLTRLILPDINMPATTALAVSDTCGHSKGLSVGANVIMPNVGNIEYKKLYKIYPKDNALELTLKDQLSNIEKILKQQQRTLGKSYGYRKKSSMQTI